MNFLIAGSLDDLVDYPWAAKRGFGEHVRNETRVL
jgi:hypothetical protein